MNYETITRVNGSTQQVTGFMAVSPNRFLDSSNIRFMLMSQDWVVLADHTQKSVEVTFIPDLMKHIGDGATLDIGEFMMDDDEFKEFSQYNVKDMQDSVIITLGYSKRATKLKELRLVVSKQGSVLTRYSGVLKYPAVEVDGDEVLSGDEVVITFNCYNIRQQPSQSLFDASRLISGSGKRAYLRRFQNYKLLKD